jgi:2-C-methyl-D-erythritol 4-phosphate cytidylyltransferase
MPRFAVILPAAGRSSRIKDKEKKPYVNHDGRADWLRTAELFVTRDDVAQTLLVIDPNDEEMVRRRYTPNMAFMNIALVQGGRERFESVANALAKLSPEAEFVVIHDVVRPCLTEELINAVFGKAAQTGAALLAVPVADTVKRVDDRGQVQGTLPRQGLWLAQTPQVFRRDWLEAAYAGRGQLKQAITDDAQLIEAAGHPVAVVEGSPSNLKITTKADLALAEAVLKSRPKPKGTGPIHPFAEEEMWGGRGLK